MNSERPDPFTFGQSIPPGLGINLLVRQVEASAQFQSEVFGARINYCEEHFAILSLVGATWMLHSDWSYRKHPLRGAVEGLQARGGGVELRLYGVDPDACVKRALARDGIVLSSAMDQAHGLREAYILDPDGYVFVPSMACATPPGNT